MLEALTALDWVGQVNDAAVGEADVPESRYVLLANPGATLAPLVQRLLLERSESLQPLWSKARLEGLLLEDVLQTSAGTEPALGVQRVV